MKTAKEILHKVLSDNNADASHCYDEVLIAMEEYHDQFTTAPTIPIEGKRLSEISDEDLLKTAKLTGWFHVHDNSSLIYYKNQFDNPCVRDEAYVGKYTGYCLKIDELNYKQADYLRFNGYDVPNEYPNAYAPISSAKADEVVKSAIDKLEASIAAHKNEQKGMPEYSAAFTKYDTIIRTTEQHIEMLQGLSATFALSIKNDGWVEVDTKPDVDAEYNQSDRILMLDSNGSMVSGFYDTHDGWICHFGQITSFVPTHWMYELQVLNKEYT